MTGPSEHRRPETAEARRIADLDRLLDGARRRGDEDPLTVDLWRLAGRLSRDLRGEPAAARGLSRLTALGLAAAGVLLAGPLSPRAVAPPQVIPPTAHVVVGKAGQREAHARAFGLFTGAAQAYPPFPSSRAWVLTVNGPFAQVMPTRSGVLGPGLLVVRLAGGGAVRRPFPHGLRLHPGRPVWHLWAVERPRAVAYLPMSSGPGPGP